MLAPNWYQALHAEFFDSYHNIELGLLAGRDTQLVCRSPQCFGCVPQLHQTLTYMKRQAILALADVFQPILSHVAWGLLDRGLFGKFGAIDRGRFPSFESAVDVRALIL